MVVITNQSGVGRGYFTEATLVQIHEHMKKELARHDARVDAIYYCPHHPDDRCDCRKPKPGMLHEIAKRFDVSLKGVPTVGDSLRDLQAASAAGARPVLVLTGKGEQTLKAGGLPAGRTGRPR